MSNCPNCGSKTKFFRRFKVDYDATVFLPCEGCGHEILNKKKLFLHALITGGIFAMLLVFGKYLVNDMAEFLLAIIVPSVYYLIFIPVVKE